MLDVHSEDFEKYARRLVTAGRLSETEVSNFIQWAREQQPSSKVGDVFTVENPEPQAEIEEIQRSDFGEILQKYMHKAKLAKTDKTIS